MDLKAAGIDIKLIKNKTKEMKLLTYMALIACASAVGLQQGEEDA